MTLRRSITSIWFLGLAASLVSFAGADDISSIQVPDGFQVSVYARDPLVRNPCAMAFDARGRLFVGQGPQYRNPTPDSPTDRVTLLIDSNDDGVADQAKTFAEGFNNIQGLAWYGDQLWIANAPDLTVVRDVDGDDQADEYRRIYGGLGNLEHALHGLIFAPDGRLYMSKGNSKGYMSANSSERFVSPAAFADLWGIDPPSDAPTKPEAKIDTRETYKHGYHTPSDDWGTEGGILRCRPDGSELQIYARGMRNMWDMNIDADFNWVGTDQDQDGGDRILSPFLGAHFGWGHAWSPHWTGKDHLPSTPISGPVFHGSGTGVVSCASQKFPPEYQDTFFCADWLSRSIFVYRPQWDGALMRNMKTPEVFAKAPRGRSMGSSQGILFDPTDIEFGPDGAMWVMSWGHSYGVTEKDGKQVDEGRVYRISFGEPRIPKLPKKYSKRMSDWTLAELIEDLRHDELPVRRINAQIELIRRGNVGATALAAKIQQLEPDEETGTWLICTLFQMEPDDKSIDSLLNRLAEPQTESLTRRILAIRTLGYRSTVSNRPLSDTVRGALADEQARIRFAAVQAIHESRSDAFVGDLWKMVSTETDRATFYAARTALGALQNPAQLRRRLATGTLGQRKAALLSLLEQAQLTGDDVLPLRLDSDPVIAGLAASFVSKVGTSEAPVLSIEPKGDAISNQDAIRIVTGKIPDGLHVRYSIDGAEPTDTTGKRYRGPFRLQQSAVVSASLFRERERMGPVVRRTYSITHGGNTNARADVRTVYPVEIGQASPASGRPYRAATLGTGERVFGNREYVWKELPKEFAGHTFIQPRNGDKDVGSTGDKFLSFDLKEPAEIYIAHDRRIGAKPDWLNQFASTNFSIATNDARYDLFVKTFPAGRVTLGGNTRDGQTTARSQYVCIVKPAKLQIREVATTINMSLEKMQTADFRRGARLFFQQADCAKCHRMSDRGNAFAPNLSNMGTRATPKTIAESILKPNAVIMEGFHSVSVLTDEGQVHTGFIKQESGLNVQLVQGDGKVITIPRTSIEQRKRQKVSAMPEGMGKQLGPQQVADIVRFIIDAGKNPALLAQTDPTATGKLGHGRNPNEDAKPLDTTTPISIQDNGNALQIHCGEKEVATYFYQHDKVRRPFFAHVKAPSGTQVTRNFPPADGDRKDHDDMHPGLWLGFGDISGVDFWRNKGHVVHERFSDKPSGGLGRGSFSQLKSYQRPDGSVVCIEDFRCTIHVLKEGYMLAFDSTFSSPDGKEFYFGDQEEMGIGIRVTTPITEQNSGRITDSEGREGAKTIWSQSSAWCDYSGMVGDETLGMAILCHPDNFRKSWMHARNYGLIAANAFGREAMKKGAPSKIVVKPGESLRLRYGVLLHGPKPDLENIHRQYVELTTEEISTLKSP